MVETLSPDFASGSAAGLPVDAGVMYVDHKGVHKPRIEKKQRKLAAKLPFLADFLEEDEELKVITTAVSPTSLLDQLTTGVMFVYIKRCLLVITDRRILHIPTTMGYKYRQTIAQVRFGDLDSIAQKGSRLKLRYKSGAGEQFLYIRRSERKKIRSLLSSLKLDGATSSAGRRVHLCPRCGTEQQSNIFECPQCQLEFKSRKKALGLSIWLPGGGYFYTGHPLLGIGDAFVELLLISGIILSLIPTAEYPEPDIASASVIGVILLIEKLVTIYHANHFVREYLPKDRRFKPAGEFG